MSAVGCKRGCDSSIQQSSLPGTADGREEITELTGEVSMEGTPGWVLRTSMIFPDKKQGAKYCYQGEQHG